VHPREYSIPSPASSQWHLGIKSTVMPRHLPCAGRSDSFSLKSRRLPRKYFKLVSGSTTQSFFFLPLTVYFNKFVSSIQPCSHKIWNIPLGWPSQPSWVFGVVSMRLICMFLQSLCKFFMFPVPFAPFSCSFRLSCSFVYFFSLQIYLVWQHLFVSLPFLLIPSRTDHHR
jgi:hypothetical protein